jgi:uncharacterized protein YciI
VDKKPFLLKLFAPRVTFHLDMTEAERAVMQEHGVYWRGLLDQGVAVAYGPVLDPKGSWGVAIMEVEDAAAAENVACNDPAGKSGMHIEVYPMAALVKR